jgi:hypothetical protein
MRQQLGAHRPQPGIAVVPRRHRLLQQAHRDPQPGGRDVWVELVADNLLEQPVNGQRLLTGLDERKAVQRGDGVVQRERISREYLQGRRRRVEPLAEQLARDLLRLEERAHL